ncbi:pollen-specific leucine-rich repeat extensin-like protein 1 [Humulus lupulus]|uniref:pollen-specific leucine-rich repeat extensin-like protein 1 n=1 Tax=Humulus lupulus TaxID=3486 RepID=UPI002B40384D|nr:pollen-specific leucine-rich repeat extensin-like protein 1 [Humulus lupulus]
MDEEQPSLLIPDIHFSRIPPNRPHSNPPDMGRVKSTAQKKKPSKPSENQPASHAEIPSTRVELRVLMSQESKLKPNSEMLFDQMSNDMPAKRAFDLYAKLANKKKSNKRQSGKGCSNPSAKRSRTKDPPAPTPTKETTPPPASAREATPPFPVNPDPPSPVGQTPPPAPTDLTPPASTVQKPAGRRE